MTDTEILERRAAPPPATTQVGARAPEPDKCSVGGMLSGCDGGWCLVRPMPLCSFGFVYGHGYLCRHPEIQRIIARTASSHALKHKPARHNV
jgi:hypothetical protein